MSNNPLKYTDPTGHSQSCEDGDVCWSPNTTSSSTAGNGKHHRRRHNEDPDPSPAKVPESSGDAGPLVTVVPPGACSGSDCPIVESHVAPYPTTLTYHLLESNLIYDLPIYDYSYYPPKVIGRQSLYYTHDDMHFSLKNLLVPSDPLTWISTVQTVGDAALKVGSKSLGELAKLITPVCPECVTAVSVAASIDSVNSAVTFDGHLESQIYYSTFESPFQTPFDPKKIQ